MRGIIVAKHSEGPHLQNMAHANKGSDNRQIDNSVVIHRPK
jgi:hypothetical protein